MSEARRAEYRGKLQVGDLDIPCFVLDDGTRVLSGRGMTGAIGMKGRGQGIERIATMRALHSYMGEELAEQLKHPIKFVGTTSRQSNPTSGYEATILLHVCEAILTARDAGALQTDQEKRYGQFCEALVRSFAKIGIIALVDEATGYQEVRARDDLHRILEVYIAQELLPWAKRFPDEFYKEIFRLKKWPYDPVKRPGYVGTLTNKLVYEKMPPGVLDELRRKNPVSPSGGRRARHHQFLTEDIGNPHLERHIASVVTLMRVSTNWSQFDRMFKRAFPGPVVQGELDLGLDEE